MKNLSILASVMVMLLTAAIALAQETNVDPATITDDQVNDVAEQMFCTECENIPLDVCGTQACAQWREEIRVQLAEGRTTEEILEYFRVNHGERALAVPADPVLHALSVYTPYILGLIAVVVAAVFLARWQRHRGAADQPPTDVSSVGGGGAEDPYRSRLEQDLRDT